MASNDREFHFTDKDFESVRSLIYSHAGIALNASKKDMVYSRLARRLRATGLNTFRDYLRLLESDDHAEWQAFTNALTTNLTSFFREQHHFPILAEHVRKHKGLHSINLWCSAASTGEEPYSMAMTMVDLFNSYTPPVQIIATDLDTNVLAKAEAGVYSMERLEKLPADTVKRFFLKGTGNQEGFARVRPELRNMITFRQINLLHDNWPLRPPFDAIFCRNVMIYFDKPTQLRILQKFVPLLRPDGLLFAGHSESFHHAAALFRLIGNTVYQVADRSKAYHG
ncbi:MAG: chemotaxis protein CheR [Nitrosomonadales bacterium]|nr:MAG: chemotaxis protein CheR [Nitrosomonadales bacterium]